MKLIKINNNNVELAEGALLVPEFKTIWENNKEEIAIEKLKYISLFCDYASPYKNLDEEDRIAELNKDLNLTFSEDIKIAITKYKTLSYTFNMRYLDDCLHAANKTREYFRGVDYKASDAKGNLLYKVKEVTDALKNCMGVITTLESLRSKIEQEQIGNNRIRGGGNTSDFEK